MIDLNQLITSPAFIILITLIQSVLYLFQRRSLISARIFMNQISNDESFNQHLLNYNITVHKVKVVLFPKSIKYFTMLNTVVSIYMLYLLFVDSLIKGFIVLIGANILFPAIFFLLVNKFLVNSFLKSQYKSLSNQWIYSTKTLGSSIHIALLNFLKEEMESFN